MIISIVVCLLFRDNIIVIAILSRSLMFGFLFIFRHRLNKIQNLYKSLWNRNDKQPKKIKSTTFRAVNVVVFNLMFFVINICLLYALLFVK